MILGISGLAGSGKDTTADFMVKSHGFVKVSLADPLKRICRDVFAFTDEQLWGPSEMRNKRDERYERSRSPIYADEGGHGQCGEVIEYLTPRYALQTLGSEWGRDCYKNVWIEYAVRTAKTLLSPTQEVYYNQQRGLCPRSTDFPPVRGVVIPDCRFKNEMSAIHEAGGKVIRIVRPSAGLSGAAAQHISEAEQQSIPDSEFDFVINNSGSIADLEKIVANALLALSK